MPVKRDRLKKEGDEYYMDDGEFVIVVALGTVILYYVIYFLYH